MSAEWQRIYCRLLKTRSYWLVEIFVMDCALLPCLFKYHFGFTIQLVRAI